MNLYGILRINVTPMSFLSMLLLDDKMTIAYAGRRDTPC